MDKCAINPADETGFCWRCGAQNRNRALALVVLQEIWGETEQGLAKVSSDGISVYVAAANGALYDAFRNKEGTIFSEYYEDVCPGEYKNGVQCQDLTALTFDKSSFDLVVCEHVLEHVNDPDKALREIHRVLKPGGLTIFSVPFEAAGKSVTRITPDMRELAPRKYHKDPLRAEGALVFTEFAAEDFIQRYLTPAGLNGEVRIVCSDDHCIVRSYVVVGRKDEPT